MEICISLRNVIIIRMVLLTIIGKIILSGGKKKVFRGKSSKWLKSKDESIKMDLGVSIKLEFQGYRSF